MKKLNQNYFLKIQLKLRLKKLNELSSSNEIYIKNDRKI